MKRIITLCLTLVMLLSLFPVTGAAAEAANSTALWETENPAEDPQPSETTTDGDFEKILGQFKKLRQPQAEELRNEDYEDANDVFAQISKMELAPEKKGRSQTDLTDAAETIVLASDSYVEGTLERNGNSFTWWTDDGIRCIYNPYMREKYANMNAPENPEPDGIYNEPIPHRNGSSEKKQVYLIGPYYGYDDSFTDQYKKEAKDIAAAIGDTDGYTLYAGNAATVDRVATAIENGAVVIFDSHGTTDYEGDSRGPDPFGYQVYDYVSRAEYSYLCLTNKSGLTDADYADGAAYFVDADGIPCACINGETIVNHMDKNSPNGLVWMAMCLGMATDSFCEPFRAYGVEVIYGYSQSISFDMDYLYEETFWDNMIAGESVAASVAAMKAQWGEWDYSAQMCEYYEIPIHYATVADARKYYASFPVVVSDEDFYPGQRYYSSPYGACSPQTVKSSYTLANPNGVLDVTDPVENHTKLANYIDRYGQTDEYGNTYWMEYFEADGMEHYFALSNVSSGIQFDYVMTGTGEQSVAAVTSFVLKPNLDIMNVTLTIGVYNGDTLVDTLSVTQPINCKTFTTASMYRLYESNEYLSAEILTEYFNVTLQALCAFWDETLSTPLFFGLYRLGMDAYDGFGNENPTPNLPIPEGLSYQLNGDCATITGYTGSAKSITIPDVINGCYVTTIGENAFYDNASLTSIMLGCNITTIEDRAFAYCHELKNIRILQRVTSIGHLAFFGCESMAEISVDPDNPAYTNGFGGILYDKDRKTLIQTPGGSGIGVLSIPGSVTTIADYAFYGTGIQEVDFPGTVISVGENAFAYCRELHEVTMHHSVTTIGDNAFAYCTNLKEFEIAENVANIGTGAFAGCSGLTQFIVNEKNTTYSIDGRYVLFNKEQTKLIQAPGGIIGSYTVPGSVTTITERAFDGCNSLTDIVIPASVTAIAEGAFQNCINLKTVYYSGTEAQWDQIHIGNDNECLINADIVFGSDGIKPAYPELNTGDQVIIYAPAYNRALSAKTNGRYFTGKNIMVVDGVVTGYSDMEIWTVTNYGNGTYSFSSGGKNIGITENGATELDALSDRWIVENRYGSLYNIRNVNRRLYMQWFVPSDNWNAVSSAIKDETAVSFYVIGKGILSNDSQAAKPNGSVSLTASNVSLHTGDTFTVTAKLTSRDAIKMGTVVLNYDSSVFEVIGGTCNVSGVSIGQVTIDKENEAVGTFTLSGDARNVSGTVFTFDMKVKENIELGMYSIYSSAAIGTDTCTAIPSGSVSFDVRCRHNYSQWVYEDEEIHSRICGSCHETQMQSHSWDNGKLTQVPTAECPGIMTYTCAACGATRTEEHNFIPGDIDGNGTVNRDDVIALLLHVSMPAAFPISIPADYNGDGIVTRDDVIQLLLHVSMPDAFPLQ